MGADKIRIFGARVHNLKNIDVEIPRNSLTVITGLSGSGKSSLAFDTIFAEGQRRYIETFSAYARNFLGNLERPDIDDISGLSPVISIEQKTTNKNPRSTVGTVTEIYDYLRLLYARTGKAYSYVTGEEMVKFTEDKVISLIANQFCGKKILILAPLIKGRKGHYRELFENLRKKGYLHARVDGELVDIVTDLKVDRYKMHDIEVVIDKMKVAEDICENEERLRNSRLRKSLQTAMQMGNGLVMVCDKETNGVKYYSKKLMCPTSGIAYDDAAPNLFSFNSPHGACPKCKGLGYVNELDMKKIIPDDNQSIYDGAIVPLGKHKNQLVFWQIEAILEKYDCSLQTIVREIPAEALDEVLYGSMERVRISKERVHTSSDYYTDFGGIVKYLQNVFEEDESAAAKKWSEQFTTTCVCSACNGKRLNREALAYRLWDKNISEVAEMDIYDLQTWIEQLPQHMDTTQQTIAVEILKEISTRIRFLIDVGLGYLSLNRQAITLSGGESQRIRLATQIGSQLINVLYILDEPSIGLHQRDNERLIRSLKALRDMGNTVIVVEHDKDMILNADYVVDIGPRAGVNGGKVVFQGTVRDMLSKDTLTANYLSGKQKIDVPMQRRKGNGKFLTIKGATGNNLKKMDVTFPLGTLIVVTGVSGSGKSTLINETLQPILNQHFYRSLKKPMPYESVIGLEHVDKVVSVDQSPLGRTPRSNPATYTGLFADIRSLFVSLPEAKIRGYKPGRFSFNVKGGRCEECGGNGYKKIEMNFLPDVLVPCECCRGKRYNQETLEIKYKGKSIADVLDMNIDNAVSFFENIPEIQRKIQTLQNVGLGYISLGQPSTTLSGGESQRVKLGTELNKKDTGKTVYILDEPTTGLHFEDVRMLMMVLQKLVDKGNTVIVIEHNLDVIKVADYIIDIGPEGGKDGGRIVSCGTPEDICNSSEGYTGKYLKLELSES